MGETIVVFIIYNILMAVIYTIIGYKRGKKAGYDEAVLAKELELKIKENSEALAFLGCKIAKGVGDEDG